MDVNDAVYRVAVPPCVSEFFWSPAVSCVALARVGVALPAGLAGALRRAPEFRVLVVGFSLSFCVCQRT
eukprot:4491667-Lingulodinium_polyedra.AAC.1